MVIGVTEIASVVSFVDHKKVPPVWLGTAVNVPVTPEHKVSELTVSVGAGFTVIIALALAGVHPPNE